MKKLLMTTAFISSLAAASAFAHEGKHNHVFHVRGDHVRTDARDHIRERMEKDEHHECHKTSLSLDHTSLYMECSGTDKHPGNNRREDEEYADQTAQGAAYKVERVKEGYTRYIEAAPKKTIHKYKKEERRDRK